MSLGFERASGHSLYRSTVQPHRSLGRAGDVPAADANGAQRERAGVGLFCLALPLLASFFHNGGEHFKMVSTSTPRTRISIATRGFSVFQLMPAPANI